MAYPSLAFSEMTAAAVRSRRPVVKGRFDKKKLNGMRHSGARAGSCLMSSLAILRTTEQESLKGSDTSSKPRKRVSPLPLLPFYSSFFGGGARMAHFLLFLFPPALPYNHLR